jgi:hypothetical protein
MWEARSMQWMSSASAGDVEEKSWKRLQDSTPAMWDVVNRGRGSQNRDGDQRKWLKRESQDREG